MSNWSKLQENFPTLEPFHLFAPFSSGQVLQKSWFFFPDWCWDLDLNQICKFSQINPQHFFFKLEICCNQFFRVNQKMEMKKKLCKLFFVVLLVEKCLGQLVHDIDHRNTPVIGTKGTRCYDQFKRPQVSQLFEKLYSVSQIGISLTVRATNNVARSTFKTFFFLVLLPFSCFSFCV